MTENLGRKDYALLVFFRDSKATSPIGAITINEIIEDCGEEAFGKRNCVRDYIYRLVKMGLISVGGKSRQSKLYYINEAGLNVIKEVTVTH